MIQRPAENAQLLTCWLDRHGKQLRLRQLAQTDTWTTLGSVAIVELAPEHAIPWTAPEVYQFDPQDPAVKLFAREGQTLVGFMDRSVRALALNNAPQVWNALFTISGDELVQPQ